MQVLSTQNKYFGAFGGRYVPEMLLPPLEELSRTFVEAMENDSFHAQLQELQKTYIGRPSPLYNAHNLTKVLREQYGARRGIQVLLKLESFMNTGAHKINNVVGQLLLATLMNKKHIVAETGAGQHGLATAAACARFDIKCTIFMGETDIQRQYPNVFAMRQMGASVVSVKEGTCTLKDAVNAALKYWVEHSDDTYYLLGSAVGPYPYPMIVQYFQSVIGEEVQQQVKAMVGKGPDCIIACVGGGSNALGIFTPFIDEPQVRLIGVEAGGKGIQSGKHASRFAEDGADIGIAQGFKSYFLQNKEGQIADTYSISAGLDYAGVSPQLSQLYESKRVEFVAMDDATAMRGYQLLARTEGMLPALESAHALGMLTERISDIREDSIVVVNVSGRGDKDLFIAAPYIDQKEWRRFLSHELKKLQD